MLALALTGSVGSGWTVEVEVTVATRAAGAVAWAAKETEYVLASAVLDL